MKIFNKIVWSSKEPSNHNDVWFDGSTFQIYNNGTWESITLEIEAAEKVSEVIKDISNVYQEKLIQGNSITIKNNIISTIVDSALSLASTNPIQNKAVTVELNKKANKTEIPTKLSQLEMDIEVGSDYDDTELREKINKKVESIVVTTTEPTAEFPQVLYTPQTLTESQKAQARENIGVGQNEGGDSSVIPDWNASEGEAGFIKNKTHGYKKYITVRAGRNIMNDFNGQRMFLYALDGKIYTLNLSYPINTTVGEGDTEAIVAFDFANQVSISVTPVGANTQNVDLYGWLLEDDIYEPLADGFIPDTIARKSELTELSAEVGKKVDADFVNNAIAAAITTTLNTEV